MTTCPETAFPSETTPYTQTATPDVPTTEPPAQPIDKPTAKVMDMDKVSAAMGSYMLQGWTMLNDGCPDCNTPLMRNREATSQICVNCELNPPVDPEETILTTTNPADAPADTDQVQSAIADTAEPAESAEQEESAEPVQAFQPLSAPPSVPVALATPAPTAALPSLPLGPRSPSPQNHRASVLDPMMEARRALRPVGSRNVSGSGPMPPSTPPPAPRSSTPLPMPPTTPPPPAAAKNVSGPLPAKPTIPRPAGLPPSLPLSPPPPAGTLMPQPVPRDMRRSPQSSMVISGNILPPTTPPPPPPAGSGATTASFPSPPTRMPPPPAAAPDLTSDVTESATELKESAEDVLATEEDPAKADLPEAVVDTAVVEHADVPNEPAAELEQQAPTPVEQEIVPEAVNEPVQETVQEAITEDSQETSQDKDQQPALAEDEDDKGVESDDDFEDAEEEVFKPTEEEIKERELKREQSERASRLIGQKMLQGWTMLQDPCPNLSCHGVPLLRSREKKEYCVVCENYFQREQDLEHGKYTIVSSEISNVAVPAEAPAAPAPPSAASISTLPTTLADFPPPPQAPSPAIPPQQYIANMASPSVKAVSSPIASPSMGRSQRELLGRVSNSIILPPAASPSFAMASQQILGKHHPEDLDKQITEDEEARKHIHMIRKVGEFSSKSLPPVPAPPAASYAGSRPMSTISNSSDYQASEGERQETKQHRSRHGHGHGHQHGHAQGASGSQQGVNGENNNAPAPPPVPVSPEVQALVTATHKTIATILVKLEVYRLALEISESPKECQVLTNQIKGLMECLKACRETL